MKGTRIPRQQRRGRNDVYCLTCGHEYNMAAFRGGKCPDCADPWAMLMPDEIAEIATRTGDLRYLDALLGKT